MHAGMSLVVGANLGVPPEIDLEAELRAWNLPGITWLQPFVCHLNLPPIADLLVKNAEFVTNPVADSRHFKGRQRLQITCCQPAETSVAKARFLFMLHEHVKIESQILGRLTNLIIDSEIDQIIAHLWPNQEFSRKIRHYTHVASHQSANRPYPMLQQPIAHCMGQSHVPVVARCHFGQSALSVEEVIEDISLNRLETELRVNCFWLLLGNSAYVDFVPFHILRS